MQTTLKLSEIINEWITNSDVLPATKADYRRKIELWFRWLSANRVEPREPLRKHILEYKQELQGQNKSIFTVNSYVTVVRLFYEYCESQRYYENIGLGIKSSKKHNEYYKKPLTRVQSNRLLDSIDTTTIIGKRDKLMIGLMLTNGLRTCEVHRANIADFSLVNDKTILHIQRKGSVDKHDMVAIPEQVLEWFEDYISERDFELNDPLFLNHSYTKQTCRLSRASISAIIKQRLREIEIEDPMITAHSLRHTCGSLMVEEGVSIDIIQDMLGHTNVKTTEIYIKMARQKRLLENNPSSLIAELITKKSKKQN